MSRLFIMIGDNTTIYERDNIVLLLFQSLWVRFPETRFEQVQRNLPFGAP
jgi:hypothetical protein